MNSFSQFSAYSFINAINYHHPIGIKSWKEQTRFLQVCLKQLTTLAFDWVTVLSVVDICYERRHGPVSICHTLSHQLCKREETGNVVRKCYTQLQKSAHWLENDLQQRNWGLKCINFLCVIGTSAIYFFDVMKPPTDEETVNMPFTYSTFLFWSFIRLSHT